MTTILITFICGGPHHGSGWDACVAEFSVFLLSCLQLCQGSVWALCASIFFVMDVEAFCKVGVCLYTFICVVSRHDSSWDVCADELSVFLLSCLELRQGTEEEMYVLLSFLCFYFRVWNRNCHNKTTWWSGARKCSVKARNLMSAESSDWLLGCNKWSTTVLTSADSNITCETNIDGRHILRHIKVSSSSRLMSTIRSVTVCLGKVGPVKFFFFFPLTSKTF